MLGGSSRRRLRATQCAAWQGLLQRSKRSAFHLVHALSTTPFGIVRHCNAPPPTMAFPSAITRLWVSARPPRPAATGRRPLPTRCQHLGLARGSHDVVAWTPSTSTTPRCPTPTAPTLPIHDSHTPCIKYASPILPTRLSPRLKPACPCFSEYMARESRRRSHWLPNVPTSQRKSCFDSTRRHWVCRTHLGPGLGLPLLPGLVRPF